MSTKQIERVNLMLGHFKSLFGTETQLCHGACIGADETVHYMCKEFGIFCHLYPGPYPHLSMKMPERDGSYIDYPRMPYRDRNKIIASKTVLIAAPKQMKEQMRGGTWQTYRFGLASAEHVCLVLPDGSFTTESKGDSLF